MNTTGTRYRTLKSIFHERGKAAAQTELQARRNGHSTYLLNEFTVGEHPLFYLADRTALASFERIMRRERHIEQLSSQLPSIAMQSYLLDLAVRSIVASDRIEGVHTTRQLISEALTSGDSEDPRAGAPFYTESVWLHSSVNVDVSFIYKSKDFRPTKIATREELARVVSMLGMASISRSPYLDD